jgi:hypothetical protein
VLGQDIDHPHRPELGHQVLADRVRVALPGGRLDLMARQPHPFHVRLERLPTATRSQGRQVPMWLAQLQMPSLT